MASPEQVDNILTAGQLHDENIALRPFRVLYKLPCDVCGRQIAQWTEDQVKSGAAGVGWCHSECWGTPLGQVKQLAYVKKQLMGPDGR